MFFEVVVVRRRSCLISSLFSKVDERRLNARYVGFMVVYSTMTIEATPNIHYFLNKTSLFHKKRNGSIAGYLGGLGGDL